MEARDHCSGGEDDTHDDDDDTQIIADIDLSLYGQIYRIGEINPGDRRGERV